MRQGVATDELDPWIASRSWMLTCDAHVHVHVNVRFRLSREVLRYPRMVAFFSLSALPTERVAVKDHREPGALDTPASP